MKGKLSTYLCLAETYNALPFYYILDQIYTRDALNYAEWTWCVPVSKNSFLLFPLKTPTLPLTNTHTDAALETHGEWLE